MAVNRTYAALTEEGAISICNYLSKGTDFVVSTFRLGSKGNEVIYTGKRSYAYDPIAQAAEYAAAQLLGTYVLTYSAGDFTTYHPLTAGVPDGVVILNSYGIGDSSGFMDILTKDVTNTQIEFECYIPPVKGVTFTANELMLYQDNGDSFMYAIFPDITKNPDYGINFRLILKL